MSLQSVPQLSFGFLPSRPVEIAVSTAPLTSDAGLLPIRQFDQELRLTEQIAAARDDASRRPHCRTTPCRRSRAALAL